MNKDHVLIDWSKPVQCKNGDEVEIISTQGRFPYVIVGYMRGTLSSWDINGSFRSFGNRDNCLDLTNIPEPSETRTYWANVYPCQAVDAVHNDRRVANESAQPNRIACVPMTVTFKKGDGL